MPKLKPIIAADAAAKPGRLMPEIPLTSTLNRFAAGAIGLLFPPAMAALPEPKKAPGKVTPGGAQKKAQAGEEKAVATTMAHPDARTVVATVSPMVRTAGIGQIKTAAKSASTAVAVASHFVIPGKRRRPGIASVIGSPMTNGATGRMTPVLQRSFEGRYRRMGLGMGSAGRTSCKAAARDLSLCP